MSLVVEVTKKKKDQQKQQTSQISSHQNFQVKLKIELQSIIQHSKSEIKLQK